jgi:predicted PurR-regulated permease PerM
MTIVEAPARAIVRIVLIIVAVLAGLYLLYLLRRPIGWIVVAGFIAVALSGPVNRLERRMRRGLAIAITYLGLLLVPVMIGALIVPTFVEEGNNLANNLPRYSHDIRDFVEKNNRLRKINDDYQVTQKLQEEAEKLPGKLGDAAGTLRDVGFGLVNSIFALVTILVLTAFMLGSGRQWVAGALATQPPDRAERLRRVLDNGSRAVSNYVGGALAQATIAAVLSYIVLWILGVPFRAPLAVLIFFFDLIPLVGATIGAVLVGIVTLFADFPTATIIWAVWSIFYQQIENTVIQPQIQRRAVDIHPFAVLVAVLCGSTLLGIIGALLAIPAAAIIQIALREWVEYRREARIVKGTPAESTLQPPTAGGPPAEAPA